MITEVTNSCPKESVLSPLLWSMWTAKPANAQEKGTNPLQVMPCNEIHYTRTTAKWVSLELRAAEQWKSSANFLENRRVQLKHIAGNQQLTMPHIRYYGICRYQMQTRCSSSKVLSDYLQVGENGNATNVKNLLASPNVGSDVLNVSRREKKIN